MKQKLVLISETLAEGVRKHIVDIIEHIDQNKYELFLISSTKRVDNAFLSGLDALKTRINYFQIEEFEREISFISDLKALKKIYRILKEISPDIVHCHSSKAGVLGRMAAKIFGVKKIFYTPHGYAAENTNLGSLKKKLFVIIEKIMNMIVGSITINVSNGEKNFAIDSGIAKANKQITIYNGIEKNFNHRDDVIKDFKLEHNIGEKDICIGTVARLMEQKDPDTFINIIKKISSVNSNIKAVIIGEGEMKEEISSFLRKNRLEKNIILSGFRENSQELVEGFDIYLSSSLYEGLPYTIIEAMRAKKPIIATNVIGNNELVKDGANGYLFEAGDSDTAVSKLATLLKDEKKRQQFGEKSYEMFISNFTVDKMITKLTNLYENGVKM